MAYFFDPNDAKRSQLTSVELLNDGVATFAVWHDGSEQTEIRLTPPPAKDGFINPQGDQLDMFARTYHLLGSCNSKTAQFYLLTSPPRPYSIALEIKIAKATSLPAPPLEKQATRMQCWAAAISSWKQVVGKSPGKSTQAELASKYADRGNGGCSEDRIKTVLREHDLFQRSFHSFELHNWPLSEIATDLANQKYPILIYKSSQLNSHTVVVYGLHSPTGTYPALKVMNPWENGSYDDLPLSSLVGKPIMIATRA